MPSRSLVAWQRLQLSQEALNWPTKSEFSPASFVVVQVSI